jgi:hypothetical protein
MKADFSEVNLLVGDFTRAGLTAGTRVVPILQRGGGNMQREARRNIAGLAHAPHYPASITFDVDSTIAGVAVEVGPDKDRPQGALGNLLEYGSAKNPPHAHLGPALDREAPNIERYILKELSRL